MTSVRELLRRGETLPSDSPRRDVEILLGHCLGKSRSWLYTWPEVDVAPTTEHRFEALLQRRAEGEPVAYLVGEREFWSLSLAVDTSTLIPRPETETLVAWALELPLPRAASALDLGTGTGAIALALASERPEWQLRCTDVSESAVALARRNAKATDLEQVQCQVSNWFADIEEQRFDLVVSNPPYIDAIDPHLDVGDVRYEPRSALVAGDNGLADLTHLAGSAPAHLSCNGWLLLEHGFDQGRAVRELLREHGFMNIETRLDLAGHERVTGGRRGAD